MTLDVLSQRWSSALAEVGASDPGHSHLADLLQMYQQPHRYYHNSKHIESVLTSIDQLSSRVPEINGSSILSLVDLAAFFHDVIYHPSPGAPNEEESAQYASKVLSQLDVSDEVISEVKRLIKLTQQHEPQPEDTVGALLVDADLTILSSAWPLYRLYVDGVRREYDCTDLQWRNGRSKVLLQLLDKSIFHLPNTIQLENMARANMRWELFELGARYG